MSKTLELAKLTKNPFTLVPEEKVTVWAGYKELRQQLLDIVESCRSDRVGLSEFVVLHGDWGTGKSHALRYLLHWITEATRDDYNSAAVYLQTMRVAPKVDFVAIYRRIVEQLMPHIKETAEWLDMAVEDTVKMAKPSARREEVEKEIEEKYTDTSITPAFPSLPLLLKGIKDGRADAMALVSAHAPKNVNLAPYNLTAPIETEYDAINCLGAYVHLCTQGTSALSGGNVLARNKAFYFLLDECEMLQYLKPAESLSINQGIRDLINACPENCCFLFGLSGEMRTIFAIFDEPIVRRFSRDPIEIKPLDEEQAVDFLKEVLKNYRADPKDPDEYPFKEVALRKIAEETQDKTAAGLFRNCRRVLERAVLENRLKAGGWIEKKDVEDLM